MGWRWDLPPSPVTTSNTDCPHWHVQASLQNQVLMGGQEDGVGSDFKKHHVPEGGDHGRKDLLLDPTSQNALTKGVHNMPLLPAPMGWRAIPWGETVHQALLGQHFTQTDYKVGKF